MEKRKFLKYSRKQIFNVYLYSKLILAPEKILRAIVQFFIINESKFNRSSSKIVLSRTILLNATQGFIVVEENIFKHSTHFEDA